MNAMAVQRRRGVELLQVKVAERPAWLADQLDEVHQDLEGQITHESKSNRVYVDGKVADLNKKLDENTAEMQRLRTAITTAAISLCVAITGTGAAFLVFR